MLATRARMAASGIGAAGQYSVDFNATTTAVNCGSDASLDGIHDGEFTAEAWVKFDGYGEGGDDSRVFWKSLGFNVWFNDDGKIRGVVSTATTLPVCTIDTILTPPTSWHHVALYFNDAGDRKVYMALDGTWTTGAVVGVGAVNDDSATDFIIGNNHTGIYTHDGQIAWVRLSDNDRYSHSSGFTPAAKDAPPATDGNTIEQWNFNDGSGTTASAEVNGSNDGTITDGAWIVL